ncbi:MAG TPA: hypothetical protein VF828_04005 [Patescibacteria group bacterium]
MKNLKINKYLLIFLAVFNVLAVIYLAALSPVVGDLPGSVISTLPGDTTQIANVRGYFTNQTRNQVMAFYNSAYKGLFRIRLNHPPEKSKEIYVDTMQSYYLEEFVLPFKETFYVNGFEWANDVFTKPEKRIMNKLIYNDVVYNAKITTRVFPVSLPKRFAAFFLTEAAVVIVVYNIYLFLRKND